MVKLKFAACQMVICYGWNAHFQDDIPTVMDGEGKSILCQTLVSLILNSVVLSNKVWYSLV